MKRPLIVLTGPTAAGKTKLSIALAKAINGEIISADSAQVYKYMNIGSAKIKKEEMSGVQHYLVDILEPTQDFNIVLFQKYAKEAVEKIYAKGKIPILVGGTGFYIQSVLYDIDFENSDEDSNLRSELENLAKEKGNDYVHNILKEIDPESAEIIHANNVKRVIRAIEYYRQTGQKISEHNETEKQKESAYDSFYFVLTDEREKLYANIDKRVDIMIEEGLVNEVKMLMDMGCKRDSTAMQALGYKEIISYLENEISLDEAIYIIKRDTRHFAKRQLTWFRREKDVIWVEKDKFAYDEEKMLKYMLDIINTEKRG
ncbi:MAG: tRNA (adenosine(37)-N6)-dimethylallyltransferase MiaA [Lachnospiraceae bacterium]|nr:tRNA (adenosine(37)-N6)-dimethylallyltransferase MiaA [Lachnospiraceae bacterium]MBQ5852234.1 tRNA (adenosine(37)-N6)-dimethylallyltransferase MiaA [Lachnospiraceae bacterium]MEE0920280.1 tRNA (adenosine(37)-N6)-dimethylallyltransferase MiaA [Lachnospiraceae bacterium]